MPIIINGQEFKSKTAAYKVLAPNYFRSDLIKLLNVSSSHLNSMMYKSRIRPKDANRIRRLIPKDQSILVNDSDPILQQIKELISSKSPIEANNIELSQQIVVKLVVNSQMFQKR